MKVVENDWTIEFYSDDENSFVVYSKEERDVGVYGYDRMVSVKFMKEVLEYIKGK